MDINVIVQTNTNTVKEGVHTCHFRTTCIDKCIDDMVDEWHDDDALLIPLYEYLGLSKEELEIYLKHPEGGKYIYYCKQHINHMNEAINAAKSGLLDKKQNKSYE